MSVSVNQAQKRLALVWMLGAGTALLLLLWEGGPGLVLNAQTQSDVWQWLSPLLLPFLTLIVSSVVAEAQRQNPSNASTNDLAFGLAWWMSIAYLAAIAWLLYSLSYSPNKPTVDSLKLANNWLTALQGLLGISLGVFFTQRRRASAPKANKKAPAKDPADPGPEAN